MTKVDAGFGFGDGFDVCVVVAWAVGVCVVGRWVWPPPEAWVGVALAACVAVAVFVCLGAREVAAGVDARPAEDGAAVGVGLRSRALFVLPPPLQAASASGTAAASKPMR